MGLSLKDVLWPYGLRCYSQEEVLVGPADGIAVVHLIDLDGILQRLHDKLPDYF